jgi:hypothetical protein
MKHWTDDTANETLGDTANETLDDTANETLGDTANETLDDTANETLGNCSCVAQWGALSRCWHTPHFLVPATQCTLTHPTTSACTLLSQVKKRQIKKRGFEAPLVPPFCGNLCVCDPRSRHSERCRRHDRAVAKAPHATGTPNKIIC